MTGTESPHPDADARKATLHDRLALEWERVLSGAGISLTPGGLIEALGNLQLNIRTGAAIILGRRQEAAALPFLKALMDDQPMVRVEAAMSLVLLGDESGKPSLIGMLDDDLFSGSPVTAAAYLAALGDPRGYPVVLQALASRLAGIRLTGAVALRSFIGYHGREAGGNRIDLFDTVRKALQDPSPMVRRELLYVLAGLGEAGAAAVLSSVARSDRDKGVRIVARHLSALKKQEKK